MSAPSASLRASVLRQVEYYFCDVALPYDEFLLGQYKEHGGIPVTTLADSPRIIKMLDPATAEERAALIAEVLEAESDTLKVVDGKITRLFPLPLEDEAAPRSVYISGAPKHLDGPALQAALAEGPSAASYLPIVSVHRLRDLQRDRSFSGQFFIECEDAEKAEALRSAADKSRCNVICQKAKLLVDFFAKQHESQLEQREKLAGKKRAREEKGDAGGTSAAAPPQAEETPEAKAEREAKEAAAKEAQAAEERKLVLRFEGAGEGAGREEVQAVMPKDVTVKYIDFSREGERVGHVRFESADGCTAALEALTATPPPVGDATPSWRMLTVEESAAYWASFHEKRREQQAHKKQNRGGGKGGKGKGGWGRGRGRGGGRR